MDESNGGPGLSNAMRGPLTLDDEDLAAIGNRAKAIADWDGWRDVANDDVIRSAAWRFASQDIPTLLSEVKQLRSRDRLHQQLRSDVGKMLRELPADLPVRAKNMRLAVVADLTSLG